MPITFHFKYFSETEGQIFHPINRKMRMIIWGEGGKPKLRLGHQTLEPALSV